MFINPFSDFNSVRDLSLYIRDSSITTRIEANIEIITSSKRGDDLLITGPAGAGKSSLFNYTKMLCEQEQVFVVEWALRFGVETLSPLDFFRVLEDKIVRTIRRDLRYRNFRKPGLVAKFIDYIKSFSVGPVTFDPNARDRDPAETINFLYDEAPDFFRELAIEIFEVTGYSGILLLFDDADQIPAPVFELFRDIFPERNLDGYYTIFIASGEKPFVRYPLHAPQTLSELNRDLASRLLRSYREIKLKTMDFSDVKNLLLNTIYRHLGTNYWIDDKHIELIRRMSGGNPHLAYRLGGYCFEYGRHGTQLRLTRYIVNIAQEEFPIIQYNVELDPMVMTIVNEQLDER